jgi:hypothetical protein
LLYAGVERFGGAPMQMLRWTVGGRSGWYDAASLSQVSSSALAWPVSARITSGFGMRYHPILHFARMHKGMDFGARWGSPIVASADGVVGARGLGRRLWPAGADQPRQRDRHQLQPHEPDGGVARALVRQGQLIGYVGTTGLSTGAAPPLRTAAAGTAARAKAETARIQRIGASFDGMAQASAARSIAPRFSWADC